MHTSFASIVLVLFASGAPGVLGQEQETQAPLTQRPARNPSLDPAAIQARATTLGAIPAEEQTEDQASELQRLEGALRALEQADVEWAKVAEFEAMAETAPDEITALQAGLQVDADEGLPVPANATLEWLTQTAQSLQDELQTKQNELLDLDGQVNERATRRQEILKLIPATNEELRALNESLAAAADTALDGPLEDAVHLNRLARKEAAEARLARLKAENAGFSTATELLRLERSHADRDLSAAQQAIVKVQGRIDQLRQEDAAQAQREAEAKLKKLADSDPVVLALLQENIDLTAENQRITLRLGEVPAENAADLEKLTRWRTELEQLTTQESQFGLSQAVGMRLRSRQAVIPSVRAMKAKLGDLNEEVSRASERWFELSGLSDPRDHLLGLRSRLNAPQQAAAEPATQEALQRRSELRSTLLTTYDRYLTVLAAASQAQGQLTDVVQEYSEFIQERIFWVRSAPAFDLDEFSKVQPALEHLIDPSRWEKLREHSAASIREHPFRFVLTLAIGLTLMGVRRLLVRWLVRTSKSVPWSYRGRIGTTLVALGATIGAALALPSLFWLTALWIGDPNDAEGFGYCIAVALSRTGLMLFGLSFLSLVCRPSGLGTVHFRWPPDTCEYVRRQLRWFIPTILPLAFLGKLSWQRSGVTFDDSLARIVGMAGLIVFAVFLDRLFRPKSGAFGHFLEQHPSGWANRTRFLWYPLAVLAPVGLAVTAALGYTFTASQILNRLSSMALLSIAFVVGYGVLLRGLFLGERRLALAKFKADPSDDKSDSLGDDDTFDAAQLSSQARVIVRLALTVSIAVSLMILWIDVLPVLRQLQRIELLATGTELVKGEEVTAYLTLADVLVGALIFFATFVVSRNLAGTLELMVLRRLPMSAGARYATETVAKYAVVIIGLVAGFDRLGIGWGKVQFLAAAVTVGLGFGLQEIFANFVSGLIILFERPIRVGDTVTVGEITGEVTRIRMRATTITDWDRKELIIPNKEFVTGQVINWSLSDAVIRARVSVGIAYGSDTAKAREILANAARENTRVLRDPSFDVRFREFGDSSLDFELRVFVKEIDDYVAVKDELHDAIDQGFRAAGVEIAFPQRDLHIRSSETPIEVKDLTKRSSGEPWVEGAVDPRGL